VAFEAFARLTCSASRSVILLEAVAVVAAVAVVIFFSSRFVETRTCRRPGTASSAQEF
jgi:hypothetical protein